VNLEHSLYSSVHALSAKEKVRNQRNGGCEWLVPVRICGPPNQLLLDATVGWGALDILVNARNSIEPDSLRYIVSVV